jgi:hypothetical protein
MGKWLVASGQWAMSVISVSAGAAGLVAGDKRMERKCLAFGVRGRGSGERRSQERCYSLKTAGGDARVTCAPCCLVTQRPILARQH